MTEKRYSYDSEYAFEIYDKITEKHYDGRVGHQKQLCDLLNNHADENERLKLENNVFVSNTTYILVKYQHLFNQEIADEILNELGIVLPMWFD